MNVEQPNTIENIKIIGVSGEAFVKNISYKVPLGNRLCNDQCMEENWGICSRTQNLICLRDDLSTNM